MEQQEAMEQQQNGKSRQPDAKPSKQMYSELERCLQSSPTLNHLTLSEPRSTFKTLCFHCHLFSIHFFAKPKTSEEVLESRKQAVPTRTKQDTERAYDAWRAFRCGDGLQ